MTVSACLDELHKCIQWERHHQMAYEKWVQENPTRNARVMQAVVEYWRKRRQAVESRFRELNDLSRS